MKHSKFHKWFFLNKKSVNLHHPGRKFMKQSTFHFSFIYSPCFLSNVAFCFFLIAQVKPSTPVTTINTQTCRYPLTVQLACPPSIPHSYPRSRTVGSTATQARCRQALVWQPIHPSHRWYQTFTALRPNSALPVRTAQHRFTSPAHAKTPTFLP